MATAFTGWITLLRIKNGDAPFERAGTPFWTTVLFYYSGFSVGGLLTGGFWSLLHRRAVGWALMGFLFVAPVYAMFLISNRPAARRWSAWEVAVTILGPAVVGGLAGLRGWSLERYGERGPGTNWRFVAGMILLGGGLAVAMYLAWW